MFDKPFTPIQRALFLTAVAVIGLLIVINQAQNATNSLTVDYPHGITVTIEFSVHGDVPATDSSYTLADYVNQSGVDIREIEWEVPPTVEAETYLNLVFLKYSSIRIQTAHAGL